MTYWSVDEIINSNRRANQHFFAPGTMRFFRSRVCGYVYQGDGGIYFLTSEKPPGDAPRPRRYTVRKFTPETAGVETAGPFCEMTLAKAKLLAQKLASAR